MAKKEDFEYEEDRAWDYLRSEYNIDVSAFDNTEDLENAIDDAFNQEPYPGDEGRGGYKSFGEEGRSLVKSVALGEWEEKPEKKKTEEEIEEGVEVKPEEIERAPKRRRREPPPKEGALEAVESIRAPKREKEVVTPEEYERVRVPKVETQDERLERVVREVSDDVSERAKGKRVDQAVAETSVGIRQRIADIVQGLADRIRGKKKEESEQ